MELLKGFNSSVDFPAAPMTVELFKLNPDAKVILGIRYQSSTWTMGRVHQSLNSRCSDFLPCSENVEICCVQTIRSKRTVHVCSVFGQDELFGRVGHFEIGCWVCSDCLLFAPFVNFRNCAVQTARTVEQRDLLFGFRSNLPMTHD